MAVIALVSMNACSTTGQRTLYFEDTESRLAGFQSHEEHRTGGEGFLKQVVAAPFKLAGVVAMGVGVTMLYIGTETNSEETEILDDAGLVMSGIGLAGVGYVLNSIGEAIED